MSDVMEKVVGIRLPSWLGWASALVGMLVKRYWEIVVVRVDLPKVRARVGKERWWHAMP